MTEFEENVRRVSKKSEANHYVHPRPETLKMGLVLGLALAPIAITAIVIFAIIGCAFGGNCTPSNFVKDFWAIILFGIGFLLLIGFVISQIYGYVLYLSTKTPERLVQYAERIIQIFSYTVTFIVATLYFLVLISSEFVPLVIVIGFACYWTYHVIKQTGYDYLDDIEVYHHPRKQKEK